MPMNLQSRQQQAGLSLLEVLVATVVLSAGLLGLASLQIAGMKTTHNSYQMQQATWLVNDLLERMRANKPEVFRVATSDTPVPYLISSTSADYCVTANVPAVNCQTNQCNGTQMAADDIYRVMCGNSSTTGGVTTVSGGVNNLLMNGQLRVSCPSGDCRAGVVVNLQWDERNASKNAGADVESFNISLDATI
jgi:type IV pilus assembly protein PilV